MYRSIKLIGLTLVLILLTASVVMGQVVQFKKAIVFSVAGSTAIDSAVIGTNSGDVGMPESTYMPDVGDTMGVAGAWKELAAPPLPPLFGICAYLLDVRPGTWPSGVKLKPYDFRGFTASNQTDTFQIQVVAGPNLTNGVFPPSGITISWPGDFAVYAARWQLLRKTSSSGGPLGTFTELVSNMITSNTSYTDGIVGGGTSATYLIIKEGAIVPTSVQDNITSHPIKFELEQNYPNPFNPTTVISFQLPVTSYVGLKVYDMLGRVIAVLQDGIKNAGYYTVTFSAAGGSASGGDASKLSSGIYFYRLQAGDFVSTRKMLLVK